MSLWNTDHSGLILIASIGRDSEESFLHQRMAISASAVAAREHTHSEHKKHSRETLLVHIKARAQPQQQPPPPADSNHRHQSSIARGAALLAILISLLGAVSQHLHKLAAGAAHLMGRPDNVENVPIEPGRARSLARSKYTQSGARQQKTNG